MAKQNLIQRRPAEVTTGAGALAYLIAYKLDAVDDPTLLVALAVAIGLVPSIVTSLADRIGQAKHRSRKT